MAVFGGMQDTRIVPLLHQRTGLQLFALVPWTGRFRISAPPLLTSLMPVLVPVANPVPDGVYSTWPSAE